MVSAPGEAHHSELKVGLGSFRIKALDPNKKLKIMHACMTVPNVELFCVYSGFIYPNDYHTPGLVSARKASLVMLVAPSSRAQGCQEPQMLAVGTAVSGLYIQ